MLIRLYIEKAHTVFLWNRRIQAFCFESPSKLTNFSFYTIRVWLEITKNPTKLYMKIKVVNKNMGITARLWNSKQMVPLDIHANQAQQQNAWSERYQTLSREKETVSCSWAFTTYGLYKEEPCTPSLSPIILMNISLFLNDYSTYHVLI